MAELVDALDLGSSGSGCGGSSPPSRTPHRTQRHGGMKMQTELEAISDIEMKIDVELPSETVDREIRDQLEKIRRNAKIKGFRQGKAPMPIIKRTYGGQIGADVARTLISDSLKDALATLPTPPMGEPSIEPGMAQEGQPLRYSIRVEVKPTITVTRWQDVEVSVAPAVIEDDAVEEAITRKREMQKERVPVEDRPSEDGDILSVDTEGSLAGEPDDRLTTQGLQVRLGTQELIPGFADQMKGATVGDSRTVTLTFPEDYGEPELAGTEACFEVDVREHFREELPELDDDFAQDVGFDDVAALRSATASDLQQTADERRQRELDDRLMAVVIERNTFQVPPSLVRGHYQQTANNMVRMLMMQGMGQDQAVETVRGSAESMVQASERAVRRHLILEALGTHEKIEIGDDDIDAEIASRAEQYGEASTQEFHKPEAREALRMELRDKRTLDLIRSHAKITDADPEPAETSEAGESAPSTETNEAPSSNEEGATDTDEENA